MKAFYASHIKKIVLAAIVAMLGSTSAYAAQKTQPPKTGVELNNDRTWDFTAGKNRDLFSNMKNMMPGDVINNTVVVTNNSSRTVSFYLNVKPGDASSADPIVTKGKVYQRELLDQISMEIWSGEKLVFQGNASGNAGTPENTGAIPLGEVKAGQELNLRIQVTLPGATMTNEFASSFGKIDWQFIAEGSDSGGSGGGGNNEGGGGGPGGGGNSTGGPGDVNIPDEDVPFAKGTNNLESADDAQQAGAGSGIAYSGKGVVIGNTLPADSVHNEIFADSDDLHIVIEDDSVPLAAFTGSPHGYEPGIIILLIPVYILLLLLGVIYAGFRTANHKIQSNIKKD